MDSTSTIVIVLNGPPRAGKDTATDVLKGHFKDSQVYPFFRPIKEMLHAELGLDVSFDHFETVKDDPRDEFGGMTPRLAYIDKGERLQSEFGHSILLDIYFESIRACNAPLLITTCGNDGEAVEISRLFGNENVLVMRIHKDGHDFSGDSRSWAETSSLNLQDVWNVHGEIAEFQSRVVGSASAWLSGRTSMDYAA